MLAADGTRQFLFICCWISISLLGTTRMLGCCLADAAQVECSSLLDGVPFNVASYAQVSPAVAQNCVWANSVSLTFDFTSGPATLLLRNLTFNGPNSSLYLVVGSSAASSVEADGIVGPAMGDVLVVKSAAGGIVQNFALQLRNSRIRAAGSVATIAEASVVKNVSISIASSTIAVVTSLPWANATVGSLALRSTAASNSVADTQLRVDGTIINMTCTSSCSVLSVHTSSFAGASKLSLVNVGLSARNGPSSVFMSAQAGTALFLSALGSQVSIQDSVWIGDGFDATLQATSTGLILGVAGSSTVAMRNCTLDGRGFRGRLNVTGSLAVTGAVLGAAVMGPNEVTITINSSSLIGMCFTMNSTVRTGTGFTSVAALLGVGAVSARFPSFALVSNLSVYGASFTGRVLINNGGDGASVALAAAGALLGIAAGSTTATASATVKDSLMGGANFTGTLLLLSTGSSLISSSTTSTTAFLGVATVSSTGAAATSLSNVAVWGTNFTGEVSSVSPPTGHANAAAASTCIIGAAAASGTSTAVSTVSSSSLYGFRFNVSNNAIASTKGVSRAAAASSVLGVAAASCAAFSTSTSSNSSWSGFHFNATNGASSKNLDYTLNAGATVSVILGVGAAATTGATPFSTTSNTTFSSWYGSDFNATNTATSQTNPKCYVGTVAAVLGIGAASSQATVTPTVIANQSTFTGIRFSSVNSATSTAMTGSLSGAAAAVLGAASGSSLANATVLISNTTIFGFSLRVSNYATVAVTAMSNGAASTVLGVALASADSPILKVDHLTAFGSSLQANITALAPSDGVANTSAATSLLGVAAVNPSIDRPAIANFTSSLNFSSFHGTDLKVIRDVAASATSGTVLGANGVRNIRSMVMNGCRGKIQGSTSGVGITGVNQFSSNVLLIVVGFEILAPQSGQCLMLPGTNRSDSILVNISGNCSSYGTCNGCQALGVGNVKVNGTVANPSLQVFNPSLCPIMIEPDPPHRPLTPIESGDSRICEGTSQPRLPLTASVTTRSASSSATRSMTASRARTRKLQSLTNSSTTSKTMRKSNWTLTKERRRERTGTNTRSLIPVRVPERRALPTATSTIAPLLGSTIAAKAVVGVGTASTALTGLVSPTTAGGAIRVGSVASVVDCEFSDDDTDPSYLDLPIQTVIGTGNFSTFAGSAFATAAIFLGVPFFALAVVGVSARRWHNVVKGLVPFQRLIVANGLFMALGYVGPNIFYALILVAAHDGNAEEIVVVVVAALIVLTVIVVVALVLKRFALHFRVEDPPPNEEIEPENLSPYSMMVESFGTTFDAARSTAGIVRVYFLEELLVSILLQSLSGIRPRSGLCGPVAASMAVVAAFHVLYLILVRPYASRLELGFSVIGAVLLLVMSLLAVLINLINGSGLLLSSLAVVTLLENILFFVQMIVMAIAVLASQHRKRLERSWEPDVAMKDVEQSLLVVTETTTTHDDNDKGVTSPLSPSTPSVPHNLLVVPTTSSSVPTPPLNVKAPALMHNPLLGSTSNPINF